MPNPVRKTGYVKQIGQEGHYSFMCSCTQINVAHREPTRSPCMVVSKAITLALGCKLLLEPDDKLSCIGSINEDMMTKLRGHHVIVWLLSDYYQQARQHREVNCTQIYVKNSNATII